MRKFLLAAVAATLITPIAEAQTLWRQTGYSVQEYFGGFTPATDSVAYFYTGNNAGLPTWDPLRIWLFDVYEEQHPHDSSVTFFYDQSITNWSRTKTSRQTVDTNGNITLRTNLVSNNGGVSYVNYDRDEYIYDASGNLMQYKYWWWVNNQWRNTLRETYTYSSGNLASKLIETYNAGNNTWSNSYRNTYSYVSGKMSEDIFEQWGSGTWFLKDKWNFSYGTNTLLAEKIHAVWNNTNAVWDTSDRRVYSYDANNNILGDTAQKYNGFPTYTWRNDERLIYQYDANNNPVDLEFHKYVLMPTPTWENRQKHIYTYNTDTLVSSGERMYWNNTTNAWEYTINSERYNYYYQSFTYTPPVNNIADAEKATCSFTLYPNPAITQMRINAMWKNAQPFTVVILDMSGRVLKQWSEAAARSYNSAIPVMDMPAGSYTIVLNNGEQKIGRRFSVLR